MSTSPIHTYESIDDGTINYKMKQKDEEEKTVILDLLLDFMKKKNQDDKGQSHQNY